MSLEHESADDGYNDAPPATNDMALVSFVTGVGGWVMLGLGICTIDTPSGFVCGGIALLSWLVALPTGYFAQREIADRGDKGEKLARNGLRAAVAGIVMIMLILLAAALGLLGILGINVLGSL